MARIQLENVKKKFGKVTALDGVTIDVKDNEFFVLFGPAGAGKTTMLNCIAGITLPEEGLIKFDGEIMNLVDPAHRNVAMTFENYALYPQMTVYDNMAAALRSNLYKTDEATIKEKVYKAAKIMKMVAAAMGKEEDIAAYDADIQRMSDALNRYSWDEKSGYYAYSVYDDDKNYQGIFTTDAGENYDKGMDGVYPLFAGAAPEEPASARWI